jgi:hypothetical protein
MRFSALPVLTNIEFAPLRFSKTTPADSARRLSKRPLSSQLGAEREWENSSYECLLHVSLQHARKILAEIKGLAVANGGQAPGLKTFGNETGIRIHEWRGKFRPKWSDAVTDAGLQPLERNKKIEGTLIFSKLSEIVRCHKRESTRAEIDMYRQIDSGLPWYQTLLEHFRSKLEMFASPREWAVQSAGYEDVVELLPEAGSRESTATSSAKEG